MLWIAFILFLAPQASAQSDGNSIQLSAEECQVWQRELSFALSVDNRDTKAFAAHIHPGAVFSANTRSPVRGRQAVVENWGPILAGKEVILRWRPESVNIGGDPNIAISRGPYVLEDKRPNAPVPFRVGIFTSIWVKDKSSGEWLVLFDGGGPPGSAAPDRASAEKAIAAAPRSCISR